MPRLQACSRLPVLVDPSHASGHSEDVESLARAAVAVGADGVMLEVHPNPESARCDGPQSLLPDQFDRIAEGSTSASANDSSCLGGWHMIRFEVGELEVSLVSAGNVLLDGGAMFGVVPKPLWERQRRPDERNRIPLALNLLVIDDGRRKILVDTGGRQQVKRKIGGDIWRDSARCRGANLLR